MNVVPLAPRVSNNDSRAEIGRSGSTDGGFEGSFGK